MEVAQNGIFGRYGLQFGNTFTGSFEFESWRDLWTACTTPHHPLEEWRELILSKRRLFENLRWYERARVSFDATPPIVERIYERSMAWFVVGLVTVSVELAIIKICEVTL